MNLLIEGGDLNPPFSEGTRNIVKTHISALIKNGHKVIILTRQKSRITGKKLKKIETSKNLKIFRWSNYFDLLRIYKKIVIKENIHLVHIFSKGTRPDYYFKILKLRGKIPIVFSLLGFPYLGSIKKSKKKVINSLKNVDLCLITSHVLFKEFKNSGLKNAMYAPFGINLKRFVPKNRKRTAILCIRPISENLVEAFKKIQKENKNFSFSFIKSHVVEKGKLKKELKSGLKKIKLLENNENMFEIYNESKILVDLHKKGRSLECASPPVAILEAMACKTKVISTNIPEIREIIENGRTGFLVEDNTSEEIYSALKKAIKKNKISSKALKMVQNKYDIDKIIKRYEEIYRKIK